MIAAIAGTSSPQKAQRGSNGEGDSSAGATAASASGAGMARPGGGSGAASRGPLITGYRTMRAGDRPASRGDDDDHHDRRRAPDLRAPDGLGAVPRRRDAARDA